MSRFLGVFMVLIVAVLATPLAARAGDFLVENTSNAPVWITVYSAGKVRIEKTYALKPGRTEMISDWTFTHYTWHVVRYEFLQREWHGTICNTDVQVYMRDTGKENNWSTVPLGHTRGHFDRKTGKCWIDVWH